MLLASYRHCEISGHICFSSSARRVSSRNSCSTPVTNGETESLNTVVPLVQGKNILDSQLQVSYVHRLGLPGLIEIMLINITIKIRWNYAQQVL